MKRKRELIDLQDSLGVPLTQGYMAVIDRDDRALVEGYNWHVQKINRNLYARRWGPDGLVYLHRQLMGLPKGDIREVDHVNFNGLDCRRANMRIVTHRENHFNSRSARNKTSEYVGVSRYIRKGTDYGWRAAVAGKTVGVFPSEIIAAIARDAEAKRVYGDLAKMNTVDLTDRVMERLCPA